MTAPQSLFTCERIILRNYENGSRSSNRAEKFWGNSKVTCSLHRSIDRRGRSTTLVLIKFYSIFSFFEISRRFSTFSNHVTSSSFPGTDSILPALFREPAGKLLSPFFSRFSSLHFLYNSADKVILLHSCYFRLTEVHLPLRTCSWSCEPEGEE